MIETGGETPTSRLAGYAALVEVQTADGDDSPAR